MIKILDLQRNVTAILENAHSIGYEKINNQIWGANFTLPLKDKKNKKVKLLQYVQIYDDEEYIGLFRIIPKRTTKNESTQEITYECEHVLATLLGNTLFKYHQLSNYKTVDVLQYLINQQKTKHWKLGRVDFVRYFHYSWENENLLSALFSVPEAFDEQYRWTWDTTSYPWTLNLIRPETEPTGVIRETHNLIGFTIEENPNSLWNRIYPLGSGEGVNQLDIKKLNNGIPYVEDTASIAEYGLYEYTWADTRFEDAASLKATAEGLLKKWKEPIISWQVSAADLSKLTGKKLDELKEGKVVRLYLDDYPTTDVRILKETKPDTTGSPWDIQLEIGNLTDDLGTTNADLERRQQINELYSQGATNILNFSYQDNCDTVIPALIPFYVDDDVVNINTCELTFRTKKFRAYSQATKGGGAVVDSTSAGGGTTKSTTSGGGTTQTTTSGGSVSKSTNSGGGSSQTSSAGGGTSKSTNSGGGSTRSSSANGSHRHEMFQTNGTTDPSGQHVAATTAGGIGIVLGPGTPTMTTISTLGAADNHSHSVDIPNHSHDFSTPDHQHSVNIPSHAHDFEIPNHAHSVNIPAHSHEVTIPNHSHEITIPNHIHEVEHKITELNTTPSSVTIKVDGNTVPITATSADRIDLVNYLSKDDGGKISRGRHEIEIKPNGLARIEADLILRVFIRSQLGGQF